MRVEVKICGIKAEDALNAAIQGGASFIGLNFHPPSPRALSIDAAAHLRRAIPSSVKAVALVVDASDTLIGEIAHRVKPDIFQLHGQETPKRAAEIRALTGTDLIKVIPIARAEDFAPASAYEEVADWLMFDTKVPAGAASPGGSGRSFDWKLLSGRRFRRPWFLAGGLNEGNLQEAVRASGAALVDVSSGVERARGEKDLALIRAFLDRAKAL